MFKALLKTIPSLSGNIKLSCFLDNYRKNKKSYYCSVKTAKLVPISHQLYDKNIFVNLKNNAFEYDVRKFYENYYDKFYSTNNEFSKVNIPLLDIYNNINDSNTDFQFGCKRISYTKYDNQFAFFAPIYVENSEDIKDKYFKITLEFQKSYTLKKEIIISLSDNSNENYLADYLNRYTEKIDDKVIFMSSTYKNMYYGIDLLHGGFIKVEDNISNNLYKKYYTINDFDAILNFGFKRNAMMMKQIIPLCFYFDPLNVLTVYERKLYKDSKIIISGEWYTNDNLEKFYNFEDNYNYYNESIYQITKQNNFQFINNFNNIMNMDNPAFKECYSENYKYINTINKNYNRWKLKYSTDEYPYIINNNYAFSANQNSLYSYKEFPILYKQLNAICKMYNENYNLLYDLVDIYNDEHQIINNKEKYFELFNKNYIYTFYNLLTKNKDGKYNNIFSNNEYWTTINNDNKLYYKGILYDFNILYSKYNDMPKISYFSVFVNPELQNCISNRDYNYTYNNVKYLLNFNNDQIKELNNKCLNNIDNINNRIYLHSFINENISYIQNNKVVYNDNNCAINDKSGDYIDINRYYFENNQLDNTHYNKIQYIDINELFLYGILFPNRYPDLYNKIYGNQLDIIDGYYVIDINYKNNILSEIYPKLLELYKQTYKYNTNNMIYSEHKFLENEDIYWSLDKLYFSIYPNKTKYQLLENSDLLNECIYDHRIVLYIKTLFICEQALKNIWSDFNIPSLNRYYVTNGLYDKTDNILYSDICFKLIKKTNPDYGKYSTYKITTDKIYDTNYLRNFNENVIFIDPYNLTYFYRSLFKKNLTKYYKVKNCYCNFLNIDHIIKYFEKLYKDEVLEGNYNNILNSIYIKIHLFNNYVSDKNNKHNNNYINTVTRYIPITEYINFNNDNSNLNNIIKYINYDDNGYFFFNNTYFEDGINSSKINNVKYQIKNFELCFKKDMIIMNTELYNLIMQFNTTRIYKDLYLYKIYENSDYKFEFVYNNINAKDSDNYSDDKKQELLNNIIEDNSDYIELYPYFNSIYNEEKNNTKIYNDYFINNIIKCDNEDFYKYNVYHIDYLLYYPKSLEQENSGLCPYRYSLYSKYNNCVVNSEMFINKYIENTDNEKYKNYGNMITYNFNGITYGFYILHIEFDNTRNTLNIISDNYNNINVVTYFNNIPVENFYNDQSSYITTYYHNLLPYINNSNIVKEFLNNVDIVIKPNKYTLQNIYYQYPNKDIINNIYSYNIVINKSKNNIQLSRYFDNIIPYINQTNNNVTSYYQYYKTTDKYIEYDLDLKKISYIMYEKTHNIYGEKTVSYFNNMSYIPNTFEPVEYKYYNHNKLFNLEHEIIINYKSENSEYKYLWKKDEIDNIENDKNKIYNIFKEYIYNENKLLSEDDILFLYKKYDVKFSHLIKSFYKDEITKKRLFDLYSLTIKYTLY